MKASTALFPLILFRDELWGNPHRAHCLQSLLLLHALKFSLLTSETEANAAEPWTALLLRDCWLPEGAVGTWDFLRKPAFMSGFRHHKRCSLIPACMPLLRAGSDSSIWPALLENSEEYLRNRVSPLIRFTKSSCPLLLTYELWGFFIFESKKSRNTTHILLNLLIFNLFGFGTRIKYSWLTSSENNNVWAWRKVLQDKAIQVWIKRNTK